MLPYWKFIVALILVAAGGTEYYFYGPAHAPIVAAEFKTAEEADAYVRFAMEAYDSLQKNYWQKASDTDVAGLFSLSLQKALSTGSTPSTSSGQASSGQAANATSTLSANDRSSTAKMLAYEFAKVTDDVKKQLVLQTLTVVLYNLPPVGRNQLLSNQQEKVLRQEVSNINPSKDLYADVGAPAGAALEEVAVAYEEKKAKLENATSTEARSQLAQASYAYKVLTDTATKARYDEAKVEPTMFTHILGNTLYIYIEKMAPTTMNEFVDAITRAEDRKGLDSMILDFRGNIGGSLDIAAYFIGAFLGQNQYTFDLFHQGDYTPARSPIAKIDALARYRDIAILTDSMSQSTAEVIAAALKKFNRAHTVGATTRGWGTVENTFPLTTTLDASTTYALLLVHSITLRDDNQPIEGRGVDPDVNTADANWKSELAAYFRSTSLISVLRQRATKPPLKN